IAWGMTLRPEPFMALLALVGLSAMLSFVRSPGFVTLATALAAPILGATAHPTGLVAAAPVIAGGPSVIRWVHRGRWVRVAGLGALMLACVAFALVVFTLHADLAHRLADARV